MSEGRSCFFPNKAFLFVKYTHAQPCIFLRFPRSCAHAICTHTHTHTHTFPLRAMGYLRKHPKAAVMLVRAVWAHWVFKGGMPVNEKEYGAIVDDIKECCLQGTVSDSAFPLVPSAPPEDSSQPPEWYTALTMPMQKVIMRDVTPDLLFDDKAWATYSTKVLEAVKAGLVDTSACDTTQLRDFLKNKHNAEADEEDKEWEENTTRCSTPTALAQIPATDVVLENLWILRMMITAAGEQVPEVELDASKYGEDQNPVDDWKFTMEALIFANLVNPHTPSPHPRCTHFLDPGSLLDPGNVLVGVLHFLDPGSLLDPGNDLFTISTLCLPAYFMHRHTRINRWRLDRRLLASHCRWGPAKCLNTQ